MTSTPELSGRLLVATPVLDDPNFFRTVLLVLAHGLGGALALVLNRPAGATVDEILPNWAPFAADPDRVFAGGPVALDSMVGLGRLAEAADAPDLFNEIVGDVGTIDLHHDPADAGGALRHVRLFAGSAGWAPGQLENEIAEGAWFVVAAEADDVFTDEPDDLWRRVLRRQPGRLAWYANAVGDVRMN